MKILIPNELKKKDTTVTTEYTTGNGKFCGTCVACNTCMACVNGLGWKPAQ